VEQLRYLRYECRHIVKYIVAFTLATFLLSFLMKLVDVGFYGELVGMIALMSEVGNSSPRVC
jgi:hypothetical protein